MKRTALILLVVLGLPLRAQATTIVALPEPELIRHSHAIVVATVIRTDTVIHPGGRVATRATVQVHHGVRGAEPNQIILIEVPGGRLDSGLVAHTPGSPIMRGGDMVFGFLERSGEVFRPLGLSYGLLRVRKNAAGDLRVFRQTDGLSMMSPDGGPVAPATVAIVDLSLDELIARVNRELRDIDLPPPGTVQP
jgi:hypothetical protein